MTVVIFRIQPDAWRIRGMFNVSVDFFMAFVQFPLATVVYCQWTRPERPGTRAGELCYMFCNEPHTGACVSVLYIVHCTVFFAIGNFSAEHLRMHYNIHTSACRGTVFNSLPAPGATHHF